MNFVKKKIIVPYLRVTDKSVATDGVDVLWSMNCTGYVDAVVGVWLCSGSLCQVGKFNCQFVCFTGEPAQ